MTTAAATATHHVAGEEIGGLVVDTTIFIEVVREGGVAAVGAVVA